MVFMSNRLRVSREYISVPGISIRLKTSTFSTPRLCRVSMLVLTESSVSPGSPTMMSEAVSSEFSRACTVSSS